MTQNNPDFNHFQHSAPEYSEHILWHRVFGFAAVVLLLAGLLGWATYSLWQSLDRDTPAFNVEQLAPTAAIPTAEPVSIPTSEKVPEEVPEEVPKQKELQQQEIDNGLTETDQITQNSTELVTHRIEKEDIYRIKTDILNNDIAQAVLTNKMSGLEPARELQSTAQLTDPFIKLYFYTDLQGRAGDTLTYNWIRNGKRVARVRIPVGSDRWRSHASKNISKNMRGQWQVEVKDKRGNLLATSRFILQDIES